MIIVLWDLTSHSLVERRNLQNSIFHQGKEEREELLIYSNLCNKIQMVAQLNKKTTINK
jgi:hypothetical protein